MATKIQIRRGTSSSWTTSNPALSSGEIGLETDTNKIKIGDGTTLWNDLNYFAIPYINSASSSLVTYINNRISSLIDSSPATLDTLNELAAAINDDPAFFSNISTTIVSASAAATTSASVNAAQQINAASAVFLTQSSASGQYVSYSPTGIEYIQDSTQSLFVHGSHTNITASYDDLNNKVILTTSASGIFTGTTDNIAEGTTNLFFTDQRAINSGSATYALLGMASPSGGLAGQILSKSSSANYDTIWVDRETNIVSPLLLMGA